MAQWIVSSEREFTKSRIIYSKRHEWTNAEIGKQVLAKREDGGVGPNIQAEESRPPPSQTSSQVERVDVTNTPILPSDPFATVGQVTENTLAERSGLIRGDEIIRFGSIQKDNDRYSEGGRGFEKQSQHCLHSSLLSTKILSTHSKPKGLSNLLCCMLCLVPLERDNASLVRSIPLVISDHMNAPLEVLVRRNGTLSTIIMTPTQAGRLGCLVYPI